MIQECEEYYDFEARCEGFGVVDYEEFNGYGKIEVEGMRGKFGGKAWRKEEAEHKSERPSLTLLRPSPSLFFVAPNCALFPSILVAPWSCLLRLN